MIIPAEKAIDLAIILITKGIEVVAKVNSGQEITDEDLKMETLEQTIERIKKEQEG